MALTSEQETALLALLDAIPEDQLGNINDANSAGYATSTMNFAVQQSNAGDYVQKIPFSNMAQSEKLAGQEYSSTIKFMTPAGFAASIGGTESAGTLKIASTASVQTGTSVEKALTPANQRAMFDNEIKKIGNVANSDVQVKTGQTVAINETNSYAVRAGLLRVVSFDFLFTTTSSEKTKTIEFNLSKLPTIPTNFTAWFYDELDDGIARSLGCTWEEVGGQAVLSMTMLLDGSGFGSGREYRIYANFEYLTS